MWPHIPQPLLLPRSWRWEQAQRVLEPCRHGEGQDTKGRISRPPAGVFHLQHWNVPFRDRMPHLGCRCEVKSSIVLLLVSSFTHFSIHPSISGFTTGTFKLKVFRTGFSCGSQYFWSSPSNAIHVHRAFLAQRRVSTFHLDPSAL